MQYEPIAHSPTNPRDHSMKPSRRNDVFAKICKNLGRSICKYRMIGPGDRLLVGLSGGKDSLVLMHALTRLQARAPIKFSVTAVNVDMGFAEFDGAGLDRYCAAQGWTFERVQFPAGRRLVQEKMGKKSPCALCSRLRRGQLHGAADRLGCNVIVLGQHLDDLCVSLLMSLFRGNGLKTMGPHVPADGGSKRLIRPLCETAERMMLEAAADFQFPKFGCCDYSDRMEKSGDRAFLERLLEQLEARFPNIRHTMLESMGSLRLNHLLDLRHLTLPPALTIPALAADQEAEDGDLGWG